MKKRMPHEVAEAVIERADYVCEAMLPGCTWRGSEIHHRKLRSQGGQHDLDTCILLCKHCHMAVHANPARSYEQGLLVKSFDTPVFPPAFYRGVMREEEEDGRSEDPQHQAK